MKLPLIAFAACLINIDTAAADFTPPVSETLLCTVTSIYTSNDDGSMRKITTLSELSPPPTNHRLKVHD